MLQAIYQHSYLNTAALKAAGIDEKTTDPPGGRIEKDGAGKPTGIVSGAGGVAFVAARCRCSTEEQWLANTRAMSLRDLNSVGMTAWMDAGGRGMSDAHYEPYRDARGPRRARHAHVLDDDPPAGNPEEIDKVVADIPQLKPFQGTDYFDNVGYGESVYAPLTRSSSAPAGNTKPEDFAQWGRITQRARPAAGSI